MERVPGRRRKREARLFMAWWRVLPVRAIRRPERLSNDAKAKPAEPDAPLSVRQH